MVELRKFDRERMLMCYDGIELPRKYIPYQKDTLEYFILISNSEDELNRLINEYLSDECLTDMNNFNKFDMIEFNSEKIKAYCNINPITNCLAWSNINYKWSRN